MTVKRIWFVVSVMVMAAMMFTACAPAATPTAAPTQAPQPTTPPQPTDTTAPTQPPATEAPAATQPPAATATSAPTPISIGMVLVGPYNDTGWSQATYEGAQYVESKLAGTKLNYIDNAFSHQGTTPGQLAE